MVIAATGDASNDAMSQCRRLHRSLVNDRKDASAMTISTAPSRQRQLHPRRDGNGDVKAGAYDEGSDGDEAAASAARHTHAASVAADDDKAAASAARHARAAIAA